MPMVKQHRADLKVATAVASERFRKQALAQVRASLRASRARHEEGIHSSESSRFLSWYCTFSSYMSDCSALTLIISPRRRHDRLRQAYDRAANTTTWSDVL